MSPAVVAILVALVVGAPIPPAPARWVEDQAGLLSPAARAALDVRLEDYEVSTGHQVVVWIGDTLGGAALDDWAVRTFAAWKVGRGGTDDGIAMFLFAKDRTIDIEVGYGLEAKVPDVTASRIIREIMAPRLRAGDADRAVTDGVEALLTAIEGAPWTGTATTATTATDASELSLAEKIVGGILGVAFLIFVIKYPRKALWLLWWIVASGGRVGGGFRGGGGGRSGGFHGGGGRSGGGGARGGW